MWASIAQTVRCAGCRRVRDRQGCVTIGGRFYGDCCAARIRQSAGWTCAECGGLFAEDDMDTAQVCKYCAGGADDGDDAGDALQ
jgi:hypothetical protein